MNCVKVVPRDRNVPLGCCHACGAQPDALNKVTLAKSDSDVYLCFTCIDGLRLTLYGADAVND